MENLENTIIFDFEILEAKVAALVHKYQKQILEKTQVLVFDDFPNAVLGANMKLGEKNIINIDEYIVQEDSNIQGNLLQKIKKNIPDIIIADYNLPKKQNGIDIIKAMYDEIIKVNKNVILILNTTGENFNNPETVKAAQDNHFDAIILKNEFDKIINIITAFILAKQNTDSKEKKVITFDSK